VSDWRAWHRGYDDPDSGISLRLREVQQQVRLFLDEAPPGSIRVLSACSGLGLDLLGALDGHPRGSDVNGLLVELDPELAERSRELLATAGLDALTVVSADAGDTSSLASGVPADLLLLCGVFGNVSDDDIRTTAANASRLCAPGATTIWTRHRRAPDLTPSIRQWWTEAGWTELAFLSPGLETASVAVFRLDEDPLPFKQMRLFSFG
jgi:hypothetical protein